MSEPTAVQLQILRSRFPQIGEPALRRNWATLLFASDAPAVGQGPTKLVAGIVMPDTAKKRLRQKSGPKLNKLEAAFMAHLHATMTNHHHFAQSITFLIANGVRFTPDAVSISNLTGKWIAWETKGPVMRDDAAVKLKVAASVYPMITFRLVTKVKGGGWDVQEILP